MKNKRQLLIILTALLLVIAAGFGLTTRTRAVEFDQDGVIEEGEVIDDDVFIANDVVEINGTVNGDVFAAGGVVKVDGTINGSLFVMAQNILIKGEIAGSVYSGSSTFTLGSDSEIARNLFYGGFNLSTENGSEVNRDLLVGAYQALLDGSIARNLQAGVGALEINGRIGGDVIAEVGSPEDDQMPFFFTKPPGVETVVPTGLRVSDQAEIGGKLKYKSSQDMSQSIKGSPGGGVEFEYIPETVDEKDVREAGRWGAAVLVGKWIVKRVQIFVTLLLLGALAVWQVPSLLQRTGSKAQEHVLPSAGWGLVTLVVVYAGAVLAAGLIIAGALFFGAITLGGLAKTIMTVGFSSLGLTMAIFGLLVSYLSKLVVAYMVGKLILNSIAPKAAESIAWPLVLGILLYVLLRAIPILGWWIGAFVTLIGLGAIWLVYRDSQKPLSPEEKEIKTA